MLKRFVASSAFLAGCLVAGGMFTSAVAAQESRKIYTRSVDVELTNSSATEQERPRVSGKGGFPVRLRVSDSGQVPYERHVQVVVSICRAEQGIAITKAGERLLTQTHPRIFTTPAGADGEFKVEADIPLPPGDYVAQVFVCDPDRPYEENVKSRNPFPAAKDLPGSVIRGKSLLLHVEP